MKVFFRFLQKIIQGDLSFIVFGAETAAEIRRGRTSISSQKRNNKEKNENVKKYLIFLKKSIDKTRDVVYNIKVA